jgi:glutathione S-transferase
LSPLKRVPVLIDGDNIFNDSTVICEYLEDKFPEEKSIFGPKATSSSPVARAQLRYLEEFCDTKLADAVLWKLFACSVIKPAVLGAERDKGKIQEVMQKDIPLVIDTLETILTSSHAIRDVPIQADHLSVADITLGAIFRNAQLVRYNLDENLFNSTRWPVTANRVKQITNTPIFQALAPVEEKILRTKPLSQAAELAKMDLVSVVDMNLMIDQKEKVILSPYSQLN